MNTAFVLAFLEGIFENESKLTSAVLDVDEVSGADVSAGGEVDVAEPEFSEVFDSLEVFDLDGSGSFGFGGSGLAFSALGGQLVMNKIRKHLGSLIVGKPGSLSFISGMSGSLKRNIL